MVLSNYKCMHIRIQDPEILIQGLQSYSSNVSSNRIKIQVILLILQLETDYFSKSFISEMHSKQLALQSSQRLPELLFYTKKSYKILQLQFPAPILQGYPYSIYIYTCTLHYTSIQRILHPEIQFYMQKTESSSSNCIPGKKFYA